MMNHIRVFMLPECVALALPLLACDDEPDPCEELASKYQSAIDNVCESTPDCSICDGGVSDTEVGSDADACQVALDAWDQSTLEAAYELTCDTEMETGT
jgi:hypothetical protein